MSKMIYWIASEDERHKALLKACRARCKQYGKVDCPRPDHACDECEDDVNMKFRVSKERFDQAVANGEIDALD